MLMKGISCIQRHRPIWAKPNLKFALRTQSIHMALEQTVRLGLWYTKNHNRLRFVVRPRRSE
jgi:hypothetical protein